MSENSEICPSCNSIIKKGSTYCHECGFELKSSQEKQNLIQVTKQDEYIGYVQITSVIEIAIGILITILGFLVLLFAFVASGETLRSDYKQYFINYLQLVIGLLGLLLIFFGLISIYFGAKLFQLTQIGRIGTMLVSALQLILFPFGTIFGILSLYLLIKPQTIEIFRKDFKKTNKD